MPECFLHLLLLKKLLDKPRLGKYGIQEIGDPIQGRVRRTHRIGVKGEPKMRSV